jgi:hypothetical protein
MSISIDNTVLSDNDNILIGEMIFPLNELLIVAENNIYPQFIKPFCLSEDLLIAKIDDFGCSETFPNYYFDIYTDYENLKYIENIYYLIIKKDYDFEFDSTFSIYTIDSDYTCFWYKYDIIEGRVTNDKFQYMLKDYNFTEDKQLKIIDNVNWFTFDLKVTKCPDNSYILK